MSFLKNKVAVVTGGSRGIGCAIVMMLAREGCHVAFNYLKSEQNASKIAEEAKKMGVKCTASCVDIQNFEQVKSWISKTSKEFGQLDILVNNAGIIIDKALMLMTQSDWHQVIDTNLNGMFNASRNCIVTFMKQKSGRIVNISSVSGVVGLPRQSNYSAAKGGMNAFTKSLAKEVAPYNIQVNAVAPGYIETDMLADLTDKQKDSILSSIPLARMGTTQDVAGCVKFLLSENAKYITGQIIQVDGGLAIR